MAYKFRIWVTPMGYISKISPDVLPSVTEWMWLVPGSQNIFIGDDGSIQSRKWTERLWQEWVLWSVEWADTWMTNTNAERPMRTIFDTLQVLYNGEWKDVKTGFWNNINFCWGSWFDKNESRDQYVFVNWTTKIYSWQGGITEVAERVSSSSLKKTNWATPTAKSVTITDANGSFTWWYPTGAQNPTTRNSIFGSNVLSFWSEWFRQGDTISINIPAISGTYTIASVDKVKNEILITGDFGAEWSTTTIWQWVTGTVNAYWPLAKTFAQERFHTYANKRFIMNGVVYTYTGWENTDTLTGITPSLPATIDEWTLIFTDVVESTPTGGDFPVGGTPNIMDIARNQVYIWQTGNNWVWISNQTSYSDYAYTTPVRKNWEGGSARLDKSVVTIVANEDNTVQVSCGTDMWYPISLASVTSNGTSWEEVRVWTPRRWTGIACDNQFAVCNTKNGIIYISREPAVDYLQSVFTLNQTTLPISDPIKLDLQTLDITGAKTIFWRNYIWILLPRESRLYSYDMERRFWQPPQIVSWNCLSIIDDWLVVHSAYTTDSYRLFVWTNDDGNTYTQRAVMSYANAGNRTEYKTADGYFVEAKMTPATDEVTWWCLLGYKWSGGVLTSKFWSADGVPYVETIDNPSGFGGSPFWQRPFWSFFTSDEEVEYRKVRRIFPLTKNGTDFFEMQVYFECDKKDAQFKIIAQGDNTTPSGSSNSNLIYG